MSIIKPTEGARSIVQRGKVGNFSYYGKVWYGHAKYGVSFEDAGIYQMRKVKICDETPGTQRHYAKKPIKMKFYAPVYVPTEEQVTLRSKFGDAVAGYQALTDEQKLVYHNRSIGKSYTGFNLFISEYMKS